MDELEQLLEACAIEIGLAEELNQLDEMEEQVEADFENLEKQALVPR